MATNNIHFQALRPHPSSLSKKHHVQLLFSKVDESKKMATKCNREGFRSYVGKRGSFRALSRAERDVIRLFFSNVRYRKSLLLSFLACVVSGAKVLCFFRVPR